MLKDELTRLLPSLKRLSKKGVQIVIVLHPIVQSKLTADQITKFQRISQIIIAPIPMRVLFIDNSDMFLSIPISKEFDDNPLEYNPNLLRTVHIRIPQMVSMMKKSLMMSIQEIQVTDD